MEARLDLGDEPSLPSGLAVKPTGLGVVSNGGGGVPLLGKVKDPVDPPWLDFEGTESLAL